MTEVELPDGRIAEFPDGMSREEIQAVLQRQFGTQTPDGRRTAPGTTQEQAARIPPGMVYDERTGGYADAAAMAARAPVTARAGLTYLQGTPLVGEYVDEAAGAIRERMDGTPAEITREVARQGREQFREANPVTALGLEVASGVAASAPAAAAIAPAVVSGAPLVTGARAVGLGVAAGATEGAVSGYGRGEGDQRARRATDDAILGGIVGGGVAALAPVFGYSAKELVRRWRRLDTRTIARALDVDPRVARVIKGHIVNDDLDAAQAALARGGASSMLADAGPGTRQMLDTVASAGGAPLRIARGAVQERADEQGAALVKKLDGLLGEPSDGIRTTMRRIAQKSAPRRKTLYDRAYASPINYAADTGRRIEQVLGRVAPDDFRAALREADAIMRDEGIVNRQIMAQIADDGSVTFQQMPDVLQLDALIRGINNASEAGIDAVSGKVSPQARRLKGQARDLRDALARAVPAYRAAVKAGGDKLGEESAYMTTRRMLSEATTAEDVADAMRGASADQKAAARAGLRDALDDVIGRVKAIGGDTSADEARQAMAALKSVSSANAKKKLRMVLGKDMRAFEDAFEEASAALQLRTAMAMNSQTAVRQAGQEAMKKELTSAPMEALRGGEIMSAGEKLLGELFGGRRATQEQIDRAYTQIADVLTSKRGRDAQAALRIIRQAMAGQEISDAQAAMVRDVVGGSAAAIGYETTTGLLAN